MKFSEAILYRLARSLYRTEIAQSPEMKSSLESVDSYARHRAGEASRVLDVATALEVPIRRATVLDFGCHDGALSAAYLEAGAERVIGVDIDPAAIQRAQQSYPDERLSFVVSSKANIPLEDSSVDLVISYDVFEHVARPEDALGELRRVLRSRGRVLIGTWGWYHPFAPHLWAVMPVPWAHVVFSERTLLRTCRRIYHSTWYAPNMHDFDANGQRRPDKYQHDTISPEYLNKFLIRDFENAFVEAGFLCRTHLRPFSARIARWTRPLLHVPWAREFVAGYAWFLLSKETAVSGKKRGSR